MTILKEIPTDLSKFVGYATWNVYATPLWAPGIPVKRGDHAFVFRKGASWFDPAGAKVYRCIAAHTTPDEFKSRHRWCRSQAPLFYTTEVPLHYDSRFGLVPVSTVRTPIATRMYLLDHAEAILYLDGDRNKKLPVDLMIPQIMHVCGQLEWNFTAAIAPRS